MEAEVELMNLTITTEEKRLNGARYYVANVSCISGTNWWVPYGVSKQELQRDWLKLEDWCYSTFGKRPLNEWPASSDRWFVNNSSFWFRDHDDLLMFLLRWQ